MRQIWLKIIQNIDTAQIINEFDKVMSTAHSVKDNNFVSIAV